MIASQLDLTPTMAKGLGTSFFSAVSLPVPIASISAHPLNVALTSSFAIASDASKAASTHNVLVELKFQNGISGFGEAAPFHGISGDTQDLLLDDMAHGLPGFSERELSALDINRLAAEHLRFPASRAALEMAFFDALAKSQGRQLYKLLSGKASRRVVFDTDVTIPILKTDDSHSLVARYLRLGFRKFKIKVGDGVGASVERVLAVRNAMLKVGRISDFEVLIDANEGYGPRDAEMLLSALCAYGIVPKIFEQPVRRADLKALRAVRKAANYHGTMVFADESVYTMNDLMDVIRCGAANGVNLKLMKHGGIIDAIRIADMAVHSGLKLMIGGMVETRLAMTASLHMAYALEHATDGALMWLDLDTPIIVSDEGFMGGIRYLGPSMFLPRGHGIGVSLSPHV